MVITKRFPNHYYSQIDFPYVMAVIVLVVFIIILSFLPSHRRFGYPEVPRVDHAVDLPSPEWRDLMILAVLRDGTMFFGSDKIRDPKILTNKICEHLHEKGGERRVYVRADPRTKYGYVNEAIDAIHDAGIEQIAFVVEQRKTAPESSE